MCCEGLLLIEVQNSFILLNDNSQLCLNSYLYVE